MSGNEEVQTMWSESLLEHLYLALKKGKEDEMIMELIEELRAKEYDDDFLIKKVTQKVGDAAAISRLKNLLAGKTTGGSTAGGTSSAEEKPLSKADQARANAAAKRRGKEKSGLVSKIKGIFGGS
jgi:hypothetical protein